MKQIARELGVRYVIEGSVRRAAAILVLLVMECSDTFSNGRSGCLL